ncbi:PucR family transcriptional regulator [Paenibacillus sp. Aloe-11]|uniref:PucR family transcriptional regulator n=1 Tax=Paenibacillus sp. Aloe-11 TaxID=1050222 RepID=UPI0002DA3B18|nr:helix-turn-helix domain-containing protein [Paenibacillus sp. Aloe-11]
MKTTITYIMKKLERFSPSLVGKVDTYSIISVEWLDSTNSLSKDILYMVKDAKAFDGLNTISDIHTVACLENISLPDINACVIYFPSSCNLDEIFYEIKEMLFHNLRLTSYSANFIKILSDGGGLQNLVDEAYEIINNPIYIFDAGLKLLAANWDVSMEDEQTKRILSDKCLSEEDIKYMNFDHMHDRVRKSTFPLLVNNKRYDKERIITMINKSGKDVGHIVVISNEHPFKDVDLEIVSLLRDAVAHYLEKDSFIRNTKGSNYEYFIADLLDGKIPLGRQFNNRMNYIDCVFLDVIYVLVVETNRSSNALSIRHICNKFEKTIVGSRTVIHNGQIIVIITKKYDQLLTDEEIYTMREICLEDNLYTGLSNPFNNIIDLPEYYQQALRSIDLGVCKCNQADLFIYEQYYLDHIASTFTKLESSETFCHPSMRYLLDYDKNNGTELAYTLYSYFLNERSILNTSNALYVHRNTITYRLKKIESLINIDFEDYNTRQYIILSYVMSKKTN